jgi:phthalate 4,5-cis-dihydrodiol dehydrogenase
METLCKHGAIDTVYIATPHEMHAAHALTAARFGKHMIIEKPMALSLADCRRICDAAASAGVVTLVGHTHGYDPIVRAIRSRIAGGEEGPVRMITSIVYGDFLYRPRRPEELDSSRGGGILYNQIPHQVEIARVLADSPLRSVRAVAGIWDGARPTEGACTALLEFENGAAASLIYSGYDHFDSDELNDWVGADGLVRSPHHGLARRALKEAGGVSEAQMRGQRGLAPIAGDLRAARQPHFGLLIVSCERADFRACADGFMVYDDGGAHAVALPPGRAVPDRDAVADDFFNAVKRGCAPPHDGRWGMETVAATLALVRSARERREIMAGEFVE